MTHKKFKFTLYTESPVHIGSGEKYTQKEYLYERQSYYFPNMVLIYKKLMTSPDKLQKFEKFLATDPRKNRQAKRLIDFFKQIGFTDRDLGGYAIKTTGVESQRPGKPGDINQFVKDAYQRPYIPGSSLKGALRTILVNEYFQTDQINWSGQDNIFNEIYVSDSQPLSLDDLVLSVKYDFNPKKNSNNELNLMREALKPFTKVEFTITTTTERAKKLITGLPGFADSFYQRYHRKFLQYLPNKYQQEDIYHPLYLGGGSGLWTKADYHHLRIEDIRKRTPRRTKMKGNGVYKLTRTKNVTFNLVKNGTKTQRSLITNRDNTFEMGKCSFFIREVSE